MKTLLSSLIWALPLVLTTPGSARAQAAPDARVEPDVRGDLLLGHDPAVQGGVGLQLPLGYYVRIGTDAAVGLRTNAPAGSRVDGRVDGRVDLVGRFLLDPFRQSAYGVSAGAGLSARFEPGERVSPLLLVALELEGRRRVSGWTPALQVALAGGARIGLVLRRGQAGSR